ncbi:ISL LIM homeobox 1b [Clupea harengus]|uniref:Insulin gene enhancer protein ISL-1 n=1 Tax=Clupea harengus TaxID=7950 RepID=A0A6P8GHD4_CLUHA|nr:ISL LIM homeobox 1b [Clupea harengus]
MYFVESTLISSCTGCGHQILDRFFLRVSPDMEWHAACLECAECKKSLEESGTCFVKDGKTLCKEDYYRLYGIKCGKCQKVFNKEDLVMRTRMQIYHFDCFRCESCDLHLLPGDRFHLRDGHLLCTADHDAFETRSEESKDELSQHLDVPIKRASTPPQRTTRVRTVLSKKQLHMLQTCYNANPRPDALVKEQLVEMTGLSSRVIRVWFQNKRCKDKKRHLHPTPTQTAQKTSPPGEADSRLMPSQMLETPCTSLVSSPVSSGIQ